MKNVLVKIDKFEFPCDFVVTDMPENLGEMIILGRPFLEIIHSQLDVFQEEISLVGLTKRWLVCKPVQLFYDDKSGEDCGMWPTCDPDSSFCYGYKEVFEKSKQGMLRQWVCFRDHERRTVKGSCM
ncbi:hypothetical protein Tco_1162509 [Tanacetum coccineum]